MSQGAGSVHDVHTDFTPGSIKRIRVENFMTHERLSIWPSSRVNLVLGANGSGKSSIVCAMCLGLGGEPRDMNRAREVKSFVLTGKMEASIEIVIQGDASRGEGDFIIERRIRAKDNISHWRVNEHDSTQKEVQELVKRYHIQVNNPCMFLPQEKITSFTSLNPAELLEQTERCVGNDLGRQHEKLAQMEKDNKKDSADADALVRRIDEFTAERAKLQADKDRYDKYLKIVEKIELLEKRRPHVAMKMCEAKRDETQRAMEALAKQREDEEAAVQPLKAAKDGAETAKKDAETRHRAAQAASKAAADALTKLKDQVDEAKRGVEGLREDVASLAQGRGSIEAEIRKQERLVAELRAEAGKYAGVSEDALREESKRLERQRHDLQRKANELVDADDDDSLGRDESRLKAVTAKLADIGDIRSQKIATMSKLHFPPAVAAAEAAKWVEANHRRFAGDVIGPLALDMRAGFPGVESQIESAIPGWIRYAFVVDNPADASLLSNQEFQTGRGPPKKVSVLQIHAGDVTRVIAGARSRRNAKFPAARLSELSDGVGTVRWLDEAVSCPDLVLAALMREAHIEDILVSAAADAIDRYYAQSRSGVSLPVGMGLVSPNGVLSVRGGDLAGDAYVTRSSVRPSELLHIVERTGDTERLAAERDDLQRRVAAGRARQERRSQQAAVLGRDIAALGSDLARMAREAKERAGVHARHRSAAKKLDDLRRSVASEAEVASQVQTKLRELRAAQLKWVALQQGLPAKAGEVVRTFKLLTAASLGRSMASYRYDVATQRYSEVVTKLNAYDKQESTLAEELERAKTDHKAMRSKAHAFEQKLTIDQKQVYDTLPDTDADLEADLAERNAERNAMMVNSDVIKRYSTVERELAQARDEFDRLTGRQKNSVEEFVKLRNIWVDCLQRHMLQLDAHFGKGMKHIGCQGHVELMESHESMSKYGIKVTVAFRKDVALQPLSAMQSGGERALATMLFLLSMQHITPCPFRVVDEINQGMDVTNERVVMETVLAASAEVAPSMPAGSQTSPARSFIVGRQLFIISPKLMPDFRHAAVIRTHVVFNGAEHVGKVSTHGSAAIPPSIPSRAGPAATAAGAPSGGNEGQRATQDSVLEQVDSQGLRKLSGSKRRQVTSVDDSDEVENEQQVASSAKVHAPKRRQAAVIASDEDD